MSRGAMTHQNNSRLHILLVEDNADDIEMVWEGFKGVPLVNLHTVRDGEEAMAYLRQQGQYQGAQRPGLLLLDIQMPKKNGFEVLREMKADPVLRHVPVVIFSTSSTEEDIVRLYADGACSYLNKPIGLMKYQDMARQFALYWTQLARIPACEG